MADLECTLAYKSRFFVAIIDPRNGRELTPRVGSHRLTPAVLEWVRTGRIILLVTSETLHLPDGISVAMFDERDGEPLATADVTVHTSHQSAYEDYARTHSPLVTLGNLGLHATNFFIGVV